MILEEYCCGGGRLAEDCKRVVSRRKEPLPHTSSCPQTKQAHLERSVVNAVKEVESEDPGFKRDGCRWVRLKALCWTTS